MTTPGGGRRCARPVVFPKRLDNRPALPRIDYRIGTYGDIRARLLADLNTSRRLLDWTHREPDDPGIALLEGAAILGDILTFYQDLYANEAYLRTAAWRQSVSELVRLLGYRLSPALGGRATFAVEVRGDEKVTVPAGFPLKADLEQLAQSAKFETETALVAYPWLSEFSLYRPLEEPSLARGTSELRVLTSETMPFEEVDFEEDDRLIVGEASPSGSPAPTRLLNPEILVVEEADELHGQTLIRLKGSLRRASGISQLVGYKLGRSFRHFGHNAPPQDVKISGNSATAANIGYQRRLSATSKHTYAHPDLEKKQFPLVAAVDDLAVGGLLICDGPQQPGRKLGKFKGLTLHAIWPGTGQRFTMVRTLEEVTKISMRWGSLTGEASLVELDSAVNGYDIAYCDMRNMEFHEVTSPLMRLRAAPRDTAASRGKELFYYGAFDQAKTLLGRSVLLAEEGEDAVLAKVTAVAEEASAVPDFDDLHKVTLSAEVDYADFPQEDPEVEVYGNLVTADQGLSEKQAVLGDGDSRQSFQTFKLPKSPLTYHYSAGDTPPEVPELQVYVDGRQWQRVDSLYGQGGKAEVYVVRQDEDGASYLQFGDGERLGARLPSGVDNVVALYRTGVGAFGAKKPGTKVRAQQRLDRLDSVDLLTDVSGGSKAETGDKARRAAPGKIESLGRLVSLRDYESETLAISGVAVAAAAWALRDNVPAIVITVLMESGRESELESVRAIVDGSNRSRGPHRHPVIVRPGRYEFVYLSAQFALATGWQAATVLAAVRKALGVAGLEAQGIDGSEGLFGLRRRRFGGPEHATRVAATIQNVAGVAWSRVLAFESLGTASDPAALTPPPSPTRQETVACPPDRILRLAAPSTVELVKLAAVSGAGAGAAAGTAAGGSA